VVVEVGLGRQTTFWLATILLLVGALWLLRDILLPFVAGMALAYLFNPLTNRLERLGIGRTVGSLAIIGIFILSLLALLLLIVPILAGQLGAFIENLPGYVGRVQALLADPSRSWLRSVLGESLSGLEASVGELVGQSVGWLAAFMKSLWSGGQALISIFSLMVVTPVVAFYLLCDWNRLIVKLDTWVPLAQRGTVRELAHDIDCAIASFVRGQTGVCLILGSFYALGLMIAGLNFGLLIGLLSGLISFIPYVGSMTGLVLATGVAVAQFWPEWTSILAVMGIFFVGQFLEGYVLAPKLVGESVGLHPVWLMFALLAFGYLFGFVGLLLAVPLAAAIGVVARFALRLYLESPIYTGRASSANERPSRIPEN